MMNKALARSPSASSDNSSSRDMPRVRWSHFLPGSRRRDDSSELSQQDVDSESSSSSCCNSVGRRNSPKQQFAMQKGESTSSVLSTSTATSTVVDESNGSMSKMIMTPHQKSSQQRRRRKPKTNCKVTFDLNVTVHYHHLELAGPESIATMGRVGEPPFLKLGSAMASETLALATFEAQMHHERSRRRTSSSKRLQPLRISARERALQKAGVSVRDIDASVVEFRRAKARDEALQLHRGGIAYTSSPARSESPPARDASDNKNKKRGLMASILPNKH